MVQTKKRVIVIGSGVIGGLSAYFLCQKGWSVTIIEKDRFGSGASHGNCGLVVPSHLAPLNSVDNLIKGLGWMLRKDAPLYISPRMDAAWIRWIIRFIRFCRHRQRRVAAAGRHALMTDALALYDTLIRTEKIDCGWEMAGTCHLFRSARAWAAFGAADDVRPRTHQTRTPLTGTALQARFPGLSPSVVGGWIDAQAGHLRPDAFMRALAGILKEKGVRIIEETEFIGFDQRDRRAIAARTHRGIFAADAFVVATGAWTSRLSAALGCRIPIQPGKGFSVTLRQPARTPEIPCFFEETQVVMTPWRDRLRLGGTLAFSGFDDTLDAPRVAALFRALHQYLPLPLPGPAEETWCGWRPMTPDGLPFIGHLPGTDNVVLAAGHNELGLTMAPATGKRVAGMIRGGCTDGVASAYGIGRFGKV